MSRIPPRSTRPDTLFPFTTLFRAGDSVAVDIEAETRRHLTTAGLLEASPTLREIMEASDFPAPDEGSLIMALEEDPRLRAATQVTAIADGGPNGDPALSAAIDLLAALEVEHEAFQARREVRSEERRVGKECVST